MHMCTRLQRCNQAHLFDFLISQLPLLVHTYINRVTVICQVDFFGQQRLEFKLSLSPKKRIQCKQALYFKFKSCLNHNSFSLYIT